MYHPKLSHVNWKFDFFTGDAVGCAVIERVAGSSLPRDEGEPGFQRLKNEEQNHVELNHVS
jgi:hypothetical protein